MTIILYGSPFSQPTRVVHWFLMSNNIPFKFQHIDVTKGEHRTPEFLAMNPHHTIPVLKDTDGSTIFESQAILYYLRERYGDKANLFPGILGGDLKHRTRIAQFLSWYPAGLRGSLTAFIFPVVLAPAFMKAPVPDVSVQTSLYNKAVDAIRSVNDHWLQNGFIAGFKPSVADFQCYSELQQMTMARFDFSVFPNIVKFFSLMAALPHHDAVFGTILGAAQNMPKYVVPSGHQTTVLVTGANGNTGSAVARALLQHASKMNLRVIVGARRLETLNEFVSKGAEARIVDFEDQAGAVSAMRGVDAIWLTAPNPSKTAQAFDRTNLAKKGVDAAKAAGVKFVLLGSVAGAEYEAITFGKEFRDLEKYLEASGLNWCHLRMAAFAENVLMSQGSFGQGVWYQPITNGAFCPVSLADIGEAAAYIFSNFQSHVNQAYTITGPEALTGDAQANAASKVLGKQIKHVNPGFDGFRQALAPFMAPYQVEGMIEMYNLFESNAASRPSTDFERITGHKGTDYTTTLSNLKNYGLLKA